MARVVTIMVDFVVIYARLEKQSTERLTNSSIVIEHTLFRKEHAKHGLGSNVVNIIIYKEMWAHL